MKVLLSVELRIRRIKIGKSHSDEPMSEYTQHVLAGGLHLDGLVWRTCFALDILGGAGLLHAGQCSGALSVNWLGDWLRLSRSVFHGCPFGAPR